MRPSWLRRAVRNRHRHAIEQASRRWRGGRRDDSARTRRKILIFTQVVRRGRADARALSAPRRADRVADHLRRDVGGVAARDHIRRDRPLERFLFCRRDLAAVRACVEIKILRRVRAEPSRRPPRHRCTACSTAWRCRFLAARQSQHGREMN